MHTRRRAGPVAWSRPGEALVLFLSGRTARTATPVAVVVGTVLSAVNQGHLLLDGGDLATWTRIGVNYLVPYCVASVGFLAARRVPPNGRDAAVAGSRCVTAVTDTRAGAADADRARRRRAGRRSGVWTMATSVGTRAGIGGRVGQGVLAGLAGGTVFGALMAMMGVIGMIAMLVGSSSVAVGWLVHLAISAGFGAVLGLVLPPGLGAGAVLGVGAGYGVLLWVVGPLLVMPAMAGMPLLTVDTTAMMSLVGHVLYGLVAAAVLVGLRRRAVRV